MNSYAFPQARSRSRRRVAPRLLSCCAVVLSLALPAAVLAQEPEPARSDTAKASQSNQSSQGALLPKNSRDAATFRGGLVFANYCVTCHGINADGNGRAARLYNPKPANLRISEKNDA
jgi:mono/diheme cytochrome c family protein